jgi:hypothetical protein
MAEVTGYVMLFLAVASSVYVLMLQVPPALRTGRYQARGQIWSRESEPIRFWCAIVFWIALSFVFCSTFLLFIFY